MNKTIRLILALSIATFAFSSCKTKQKIAEVPAGAKIQATAPRTAPVAAPKPETTAATNENESVRNENFSLVDGDKNALNSRYHVVVGSFSKKPNAQGLQKTLISEGNNALIVLNEKGMYRVLISSFDDYNKAHARIREIANRFPDAWVLVQK